eukprot:PhM_4_TR15693/c1_g1_i1/m.54417/K03321/TC.SULP; sulfate permease, SulP family
MTFSDFWLREKWTWTDGTLVGLKNDLLAGFTIGMTQMPQAVAFSVVGEVNPMRGLFTAFYLGIIISVFGARPGSVYGPAGALVVLFPEFVKEHGEEAITLVAIFCGIFMIIPGVLKVSHYVRVLPASVMIGFCDGLAISIFIGALSNFQDASDTYVTGSTAGYMVMMTLITLVIIFTLPLLTEVIPSTIIAVGVGSAIEHGFGLGTLTVGDKYTIDGNLLAPDIPDVTYDGATVGACLAYGLLLAVIGTIEGLLTQLIVDRANKATTSMDRESVVMGTANIVSGVFSGYCGCGLIGPAILNIESGGGKRRVSGTMNSLLVLVVIYGAASVIEGIPLAALAGVTISISFHTFDFYTFKHFFHIPVVDSVVILTVTIVTIFTDLGIGVACGLAVALLGGAMQLQDNVHVVHTPGHTSHAVAVMQISGLMFFPSLPKATAKMKAAVDELTDPELVDLEDSVHEAGLNHPHEMIHDEGRPIITDIIWDFTHCRVNDYSCFLALDNVAMYAAEKGVRSHFRNCSEWKNFLRRGRGYFVHVLPTPEEAGSRVVRVFVIHEGKAPEEVLPYPFTESVDTMDGTPRRVLVTHYDVVEGLCIPVVHDVMAATIEVTSNEPIAAPTPHVDTIEMEAVKEGGDVEQQAPDGVDEWADAVNSTEEAPRPTSSNDVAAPRELRLKWHKSSKHKSDGITEDERASVEAYAATLGVVIQTT